MEESKRPTPVLIAAIRSTIRLLCIGAPFTISSVDISTTLNKYHEVDSAETPNFANDENVHDHFISGYVLGHTYGVNVNRNIEMVQGKTIFMDESWDIQGSPSNLVTRNSKISQKLTSNRQGTPFNG